MNKIERHLAMFNLYGRRIDQLEIEAAHALDGDNIAKFVGLTALAEEMTIVEIKALKVLGVL